LQAKSCTIAFPEPFGALSSPDKIMNRHVAILVRLTSFALGVSLLPACGSSDKSSNGGNNPATNALICDDSLKKLDLGAETTITLVKSFKSGDTVSLVSPAPANAMTASADVCLVKLIVGPGNPGPTNAPSTSAGIGIEVWLPSPANWNERVMAMGVSTTGRVHSREVQLPAALACPNACGHCCPRTGQPSAALRRPRRPARRRRQTRR
jgi:hypothetical protein